VRKPSLLVGAGVILIGLAGCATEPHPTRAASPPEPSAGTAHTSDGSGVAPAGSCHSRGGLPDPVSTPGESDGRVSQDTIHTTICVPGWSATARPPVGVTEPIKKERVRAYGVAAPLSTVELDHLEPVSLGGASTVANLWPENRERAREQRIADRPQTGRQAGRRDTQESHGTATSWRCASSAWGSASAARPIHHTPDG